MSETGSLGKISRLEWERLVITDLDIYLDALFIATPHYKNLTPDIKSVLFRKYSEAARKPEFRILADIADLEAQRFNQLNNQYTSDKTRSRDLFLIHTASEIRRKRSFTTLQNLLLLNEAFRSKSEPLSIMWTSHLTALYLMACDPDKFLVGTKGGEYWKKIEIPLEKIPHTNIQVASLLTLASNLLITAHHIGREELPLVPSRLIHPNNVMKVEIPDTQTTIAEYLEDAYFRQRYNIPIGGAEVKFQNAGDIEHALVVDSGHFIYSKVTARQGQCFVAINKIDGSTISSYYAAGQGDLRWSSIVAETYHDLVTAEELPTRAYRPMKGPREVNPDTSKELAEGPRVIYIQRRLHEDSELQEPRIVYTGRRRPPRPHVVSSGYTRRGNMTEKHKETLRLWQEETGIQVPLIPEGHTWVRPYFVPANAEQYLGELPLFIKKRIGAQLANRQHLVT